MTPGLFHRVGIGDSAATLDGAGAGERASGVEHGFEQGGLACAGVAGKGEAADAFRGWRHDATLLSWSSGRSGRSWRWWFRRANAVPKVSPNPCRTQGESSCPRAVSRPGLTLYSA